MAVLLAISFFVLLTLRKAESQGLKAFGYVVCAVLWVAALLVFLAGFYVLATGRRPKMCMMQRPMAGQMMMKGEMPGMMPQQK
jgi:hypothetical protein